MLCISRWKALAILLTVLSVSAMAIPSFLSDRAFGALPQWAQHRISPGIEFQGGVRYVLRVDTEAIRKETVGELRDDVRNLLRQHRIHLIKSPVVRGSSVQVRIREPDVQRAHALLTSLASPPQITTDSDGALLRLTVTEARVRERIEPRRRSSIDSIKRRVAELGAQARVEPRGSDLIAVEMPGMTSEWWLRGH
jgi:preprotein translocase subunit SecD